jgi:sulfur-carrier protein adenylyltransferase/sulfurtransferase
MNTRQIISVILLLLGGLLAFMPLSGKYMLRAKPDRLLSDVLDESTGFTVDQVARFVTTEDSTVQLIDLRTPREFSEFNIPGSVNLPYIQFLERDLEPYLGQPNMRIILYSNGDMDANYALVLARGLGYKNCFVMKGGLNAWYEAIMNSEFAGERISARENALFEIRMKARRLFTEVNSLPDSLKLQYIASKRFDPKKLDGGCE